MALELNVQIHKKKIPTREQIDMKVWKNFLHPGKTNIKSSISNGGTSTDAKLHIMSR